jgi:hypothetical protein
MTFFKIVMFTPVLLLGIVVFLFLAAILVGLTGLLASTGIGLIVVVPVWFGLIASISVNTARLVDKFRKHLI